MSGSYIPDNSPEFDRSTTDQPPVTACRATGVSGEQVFTGEGLSGGIALGQPCFYRPREALRTTDACGLSADQSQRLRRALFEVARYYNSLAKQADSQLDKSAGDIFRAQSMLASDTYLIKALERRLSASYASAEVAIKETFDSFASELLSAQSDEIRERASDVHELKHSLLLHLGSAQGYVHCKDSSYCCFGDCLNGRDHILVATQFMPGAALTASRYTRGFVVETGGPSSHAAILARMMALPAVSGIRYLSTELAMNSRILVDGDDGLVYINPSEETLAGYRERVQSPRQSRAAGTSVPPVKGLRILADLDRVDDLPEVRAVQAEGIGLYRSEIEVLFRQRLLSEDEQLQRYGQLLDSGGPVYVRLLDLGADKAADWLDLPAEVNPALGCRGARLLLQFPQLLHSQARALARASQQRRIHVLYPMVAGVSQFLKLRERFEAAISDIADTDLSHGVMFEVPGACLDAQAFFEYADFGRIGTNDLTQYLFAADRMNTTMAGEKLFEQPALWQLIESVARAGAMTGRPVSVCGDLVSDPGYIPRILGAGITEISTYPRYIPSLRQAAARLLETPETFCCAAGGQYSFLVI